MKPFDDMSAKALALLIATVSAAVAAGCAFVSTIFIGAKLFNDEWSYGVPLSLGPPIAIIAGTVAFFLVFRKMRSLAR
jgi:hypothetical protein